MAELLIATKAFCNTLKSGSFSGDTTMCPTRSQIEAAGLHIKSGNNYATDQLVPQDHIERLDWEYTFSVSPGSVSIPASGGSRQFTVTSYKRQYSTSNSGSHVYVEGSQTNVSYSSENSGSGSWNSGNNTITYGANQGGSQNGIITWTQGESGKKATATHSISGDSISSYSNPVVTLSYNSIISAAGSPAISPSYSYSQTATWTSGKTTTITSGGSLTFNKNSGTATVNSSNGSATAPSKGTTPSGETVVGKVTLTVTLNGKSGTSSEANVRQGANSSSDKWNPWSVNIQASSTTVGAAGGTITFSGTASRTGTRSWTSGSTESISSGNQNVTEFKTKSQVTGFSLSGNKLTVASNSGGERKVVVYGTYSGATSNEITITQSGDSVSSWGEVVLNVNSVSDIPASGGSVTISASATQSYTTTSGQSGSNSVPVTYNPSQTVSASSKGTSQSERTSVKTVTITANGSGGKSANKSITVYQERNTYSDGSYGSWSPTPSISASPSSIAGTGGSTTISYTSSISRSYERTWTSGSVQNLTQSVNGSISLTSNPGGFSLSGTTLSANSNNTGSSRSATVTATWGSPADITKSVSVSQPIGTQSRTVRNYIFSVNPTSLSWGSSGGSKSITVNSYYQTATQTSSDGGSTWTPTNPSFSGETGVTPKAGYSSNSAFSVGSVSGSSGTYTVNVTASNNTTASERNGNFSISQDRSGINSSGGSWSSPANINVPLNQDSGKRSYTIYTIGRNPSNGKYEIFLAADEELPITITVSGTKYNRFGSPIGSFSGSISAGEMTGSVIDSGNSDDTNKAIRYVGTCSPSSSNGGLYTYTFTG